MFFHTHFEKASLRRDRPLTSTPFWRKPTGLCSEMWTRLPGSSHCDRTVLDSRDSGSLSLRRSNLSEICTNDQWKEMALKVWFSFPGEWQRGSVTQPLTPAAHRGQKPLLLEFISWNKGCWRWDKSQKIIQCPPLTSFPCKAPLYGGCEINLIWF